MMPSTDSDAEYAFRVAERNDLAEVDAARRVSPEQEIKVAAERLEAAVRFDVAPPLLMARLLICLARRVTQ
jgi:hypothetical protein